MAMAGRASHGTWAEVPMGHVWVEGEGKEGGGSWDSRDFGPVSLGLVVARVVGVIWPWERRGWIGDGDGGGEHARVIKKGAVMNEMMVFG